MYGEIFWNIDHFLCLKSNFYFFVTKFLRQYYPPLFPNKILNIDGSEASFEEFLPQESNIQKILSSNLTDRISHFLPIVTTPKPFMEKDGKEIYIGDYGYDLTLAILKEFNKTIESYGGEFYVLLLPFANPFGWEKTDSERTYYQLNGKKITLDFMYQIRRLKKMMSQAGIKAIDFTDEMEYQYPDSSVLINSPSDPHYNREGTAFVSDCLYKYFIKFIETKLDKKDKILKKNSALVH